MTKTLPKDLTIYDLLKTLAVFLMIIDHVGFYLYLDDSWWRVFGRLCVPIWFFLIGYANTRDLGPRMWGGALIVAFAIMAAGITVFPVNILASMIIIRLLLDKVMAFALKDKNTFWAVNVLLFLLIIPSGMLFEYGTQGLILASFGWLMRRRNQYAKDKDFLNHYFAFAAAGFIVTQYIMFGFTQAQLIVLAIGIIIIMGILFLFKPKTLPNLSKRLPSPFVWLLKLTGRRTLEIYVAHIIVLTIIGLMSDPARFSLFDFSLFYLGPKT